MDLIAAPHRYLPFGYQAGVNDEVARILRAGTRPGTEAIALTVLAAGASYGEAIRRLKVLNRARIPIPGSILSRRPDLIPQSLSPGT